MSVPRLAWTLQEVAATRGGRPSRALREDPVGWAYVLREAVALAEPDLVVTHDDPALEADALAASVADSDGDWVDRLMDGAPVAATAPAAAVVELVRTLSGLPGYGDRVAATIRGPASVAARLADRLTEHGFGAADDEELTDLVADALGGLITAYAAAGATTVVVLDDDDGRALLDDAARARAAGPLARAAEHARVTLLTPGDDGVVVLRTSAWSADEAAFTVAVGGAAATGGLLLSDGPVPGDVDPARLRAARALAR